MSDRQVRRLLTGALPPEGLPERLRSFDQEHLLRWWDELDEAQRACLLEEVESVDFRRLRELVEELVFETEAVIPEPQRIEPIAVTRLPRTDRERVMSRQATELGEQMLAAGEVGVIIVAGGQGTRLGFDGPKGTYPIGPVSQASLFQIHCEKVLALCRRHGRLVPLYVMTSPENHEATASYFAENGHFGLDHVRFFAQGRMPAVDRVTGKVLLAEKGHLALSPDGHGGVLSALAAKAEGEGSSCLEEMRERGIKTLFYFQVDNPMVRVADPPFLGIHKRMGAEVSFKVVEKVLPDERVGVVVRVDGKPQVIEYSDLPSSLGERRLPDGSLELWAGSIAIHLFEREFIERLVGGDGQLPFHRAFKKVAYVSDDGWRVEPEEPNGVKFERFIFDALPLAERAAVVETDRVLEFEPLKNATGADSPATVRQRMSELFAGWLEAAGASVSRRPDGSIPFGVEISPLFALDASELKRKVSEGMVVDGPLYLR